VVSTSDGRVLRIPTAILFRRGDHVFTLWLATIRAVRVTVVDLRVEHEQEYALDTNATFTTIPCGGRR
jgi:hypothetical protein